MRQIEKSSRRVPLPNEIEKIYDTQIKHLIRKKEEAMKWSEKFYRATYNEIVARNSKTEYGKGNFLTCFISNDKNCVFYL